MAAHRSRGARVIMAKHFVPFEVQQQWRALYQPEKRRRENDQRCSLCGRSAIELVHMLCEDCYMKSLDDDELSDTEIEDDDESTTVCPDATQPTAASCSARASLQDQPIFEIFDGRSATAPAAVECHHGGCKGEEIG